MRITTTEDRRQMTAHQTNPIPPMRFSGFSLLSSAFRRPSSALCHPPSVDNRP